jgi:hypothetical protein
MPADSAAQATVENGPSGFIDISGNLLVVDHGKIFAGEAPVGFLFEDGTIQSQGAAAPFDTFKGLKTIEEIPGCSFKGIDTRGVVLELPGPPGPTGLLKYNGMMLPVLNGRITTSGHLLVGVFTDTGKVYLRDHKTPTVLHEMDEYSQLSTVFQGLNSKGQPFVHEWVRQLHKLDRHYRDNEIIRYFEDYDKLNTQQKKYVLETMNLWARSGILQIVRRSEGDCALGNVKHGASGVTGVRTGKVTLDREEFGIEIDLYNRFGPVARIPSRIKPFHEVRVNLVVSHEFGHQLEFTMSQQKMDQVDEKYRKMLKRCDSMHPAPDGYEGGSELVEMHQLDERIFISGYCRASYHEYWAECVAAFSVKSSREILKSMDPQTYEMLKEVLLYPERTLSPKLEQEALKLQTSLRVGGEFSDDILDQ